MKLLYVEDDFLFGMTLKLLAQELGHQCALAKSYEEGLAEYARFQPDLIIADIHLQGPKDGIDLIEALAPELNIPVIYLTSEISDEVFYKAKKTRPFAFLNKPISDINLQRNIELALAEKASQTQESSQQDTYFVRDGQKFIKLRISTTQFIEVQDKYCTIHTEERSFTVRLGLKILKETLPDTFVQTHRSYVINLSKLESINQSKRELKIGKHCLPVGRNYYDELKSKIQYIEKLSEN